MDTSSERRPAAARTAIYSSTQISHLMRVEFGRAQRYEYALSLAVIAIDDLESIRAARGFEFVSEAVARVGELLRDRTRGCDHLGSAVDRRLLVILPHTDRAGAEALGRRLVEAADGLTLEHEGQAIAVTISVGISTFSESNTMFFDALTDAAELALTRARSAGGSRVEYCAPGEEA